jgi:hypothetical protein
MRKTSFSMPDEVWEAAKVRAVKERKSMGEVIVDALRAHLAVPAKKPKKGGKS